MALSSAVVTANRSFWTGAKVAFPAPVAAPDPEFPELDEQPVVNAVSAASVPRLATLALVPGLADAASRLARRSLSESKRRGEVWSFGRRGEVGLVLAGSDRFMFPVTKD